MVVSYVRLSHQIIIFFVLSVRPSVASFCCRANELWKWSGSREKCEGHFIGAGINNGPSIQNDIRKYENALIYSYRRVETNVVVVFPCSGKDMVDKAHCLYFTNWVYEFLLRAVCFNGIEFSWILKKSTKWNSYNG